MAKQGDVREAARECMGCRRPGGHGSVGAHFACLEQHLSQTRARLDAANDLLRTAMRKYDRDTSRLRDEMHAEKTSRRLLLSELAPGRKVAAARR